MQSLKQLSNILEDNWDLLAKSEDEKMLPAMRLLHERMENPRSYVTVIGETSSGKSTLINAFLQRKLLKAGAKPTTGTVTWLEYGVSSEDKFYAINKNAQVAEISAVEFGRLSVSPSPQLLRLRAQVPGDKTDFHGLTIFDTPGFNSIIVEHEEVLREFMPESDVIVFSVAHRVGFGQMDQELMTLVSELPTECGEVPVLLVVNRVPDDVDVKNDSRILEIKSHAEDSLHRSLEDLIVVRSSMPDENGHSTLPNADEVWAKAGKIAFSQERKDSFVKKCNEVLATYFTQRLNELQGIIFAAQNPQGIAKILELQESLSENLAASFEIIEKYTNRMTRQIPKILDKSVAGLLKELDNEIDNASKWLDIMDCSNFITNHKIPFGIRKVTKEISEYIASEITLMDAELSEMANTAFLKLSQQAQMEKQPEMAKLLNNLCLRIGQQLMGKTAGTMLRSLGGVGGMAAGTGNLVKMGVKRIGKIFNHTFGREVYRTIGKIFTKKLMTAAGIITDVIVEVVGYLRECKKWQGELKTNTHKCIEQWREDALNDLLNTAIPSLQENNRTSVIQVFDGISKQYQSSIDAQKSKISPAEMESMQKDVSTIQEILLKLA